MRIIQLTEEYKESYEKFVAAHESGSFLQSWSWGEFQRTQGKTPIRYGIFSDQNEIIGTVLFLETKVPKLSGKYLYAPYGPLVPEEYSRGLIQKVKDDFASTWFIRVEPKDELPIDGKPTLHIQPGSTLITDLTQTDEELLTNMHQKTRYNIKVANKHGVTIKSETEQNDEAINLLTKTSERQSYKSYSTNYYNDLLKFFGSAKESDCEVNLYQASFNGSPIASSITIDHGTTRTYLFGGSDNSKRNLMAPYALHWQSMHDAKNKGLTKYDWWGTETATGAVPGFVQFKMRWGGTQKFYAGSRDIVLNSSWYRAYNALRKINRLF